ELDEDVEQENMNLKMDSLVKQGNVLDGVVQEVEGSGSQNQKEDLNEEGLGFGDQQPRSEGLDLLLLVKSTQKDSFLKEEQALSQWDRIKEGLEEKRINTRSAQKQDK
ncbi:hypothetical protein KI387_030072, partial [Taxus chinensis]